MGGDAVGRNERTKRLRNLEKFAQTSILLSRKAKTEEVRKNTRLGAAHRRRVKFIKPEDHEIHHRSAAIHLFY